MITLEEADGFAAEAHLGQTDKIGVPYIEHVRAVAAGLAPFGWELQMAGLLHDIVEDTPWTFERLLQRGVPASVVRIVEFVTNDDRSYTEKLKRIATDRDATLVKIADNAHNSRPDRVRALSPAQRERLEAKYAKARSILWPAASSASIEMIISIVNPALKRQLLEEAPMLWP
ncbi:(p)ppGpp synthase/HD superfamily hydrolase [Streptomyces sp. V3I8]|uniref:HD domain-containing protein n=1 Tax=Streptomyces sp. V3I8 TaxID=3042279 RepID=UPI0027869B8D|nr:HD domain-containing protein [Streptomyces sp. V3I8]MDQ1041398.1 (p)ppGpp synthase/HD superfamily hydrolase [Streptomyces sp. V3I8]